MRRVTIRRPGGYDRLEVVDAPPPDVGVGEIRVAVTHASVNYADCIVRRGLYSSAKKYVGWPITPGFDIAGQVAEVGPGVAGFDLGQPVFGVTRFGGYASEVVVGAEQLFAVPDGWSLARAAAFPTVYLTAWYALRELSRTRPNTKVLVHSAAGGVGLAALHICRHLGLDAIGVVGASHKVEVAREHGACHVVDRSLGDPWRQVERVAPDGVDIVLEASGGASIRQSYRHLRPGGRLIIYGMATLLPRGERLNWLSVAWRYLRLPWFHSIALLDDNRTVSGFNLSYLFAKLPLLAEAMNELLAWNAQGAFPEPPIRVFAVDDVAEAHRALDTGTTTGKLVLSF